MRYGGRCSGLVRAALQLTGLEFPCETSSKFSKSASRGNLRKIIILNVIQRIDFDFVETPLQSQMDKSAKFENY